MYILSYWLFRRLKRNVLQSHETYETKIETYAKLVRNVRWRQINIRNLRKQNCKVEVYSSI